MEGLLNPGWESILPVCGEIVGFPEGQLQPRAPRPDWPRAGGGGALGRRDWGSENAGMKVICLLYYIIPALYCTDSRPRARWYQLRGLPLAGSECVCPPCNSSFVFTRGSAKPSAFGLPFIFQEPTRNAN